MEERDDNKALRHVLERLRALERRQDQREMDSVLRRLECLEARYGGLPDRRSL